MPCPGAGVLGRDHVAPPLQANLARQRLADTVAYACNLGIEGIERKQVSPPVFRSVERREVAVAVGGADEVHQRGRARRGASLDGDKGSRHGPVLGQEHVVGAHRSARRHRIGRNPGLPERLAQSRRQRPQLLAGADEQDLDPVSLG